MKVQDILTDEGKWTKGQPSTNAEGRSCSPSDPDAVRWCLVGAILKAYPRPDQFVICNKVEEWLRVNTDAYCIGGWNDDADFPEVRALIEELDI